MDCIKFRMEWVRWRDIGGHRKDNQREVGINKRRKGQKKVNERRDKMKDERRIKGFA